MSSIILIGFMGTGKSSVSKKLSYILKRECFEADYEIEKKAGMTIPEIFENYNEDYFRNLETEVLREIAGKKVIVSCGGGAVLKDENVDILKKNGVIILLTALPETIYDRIGHAVNRPLLKGKLTIDYLTEMMQKREEKYLKTADIIIKTDNREVNEIAREIIEQIENQNKY